MFPFLLAKTEKIPKTAKTAETNVKTSSFDKYFKYTHN